MDISVIFELEAKSIAFPKERKKRISLCFFRELKEVSIITKINSDNSNLKTKMRARKIGITSYINILLIMCN